MLQKLFPISFLTSALFLCSHALAQSLPGSGPPQTTVPSSASGTTASKSSTGPVNTIIELTANAKQLTQQIQTLAAEKRPEKLDALRRVRVDLARRLPEARGVVDALRTVSSVSTRATFDLEAAKIRTRIAQQSIDRAKGELARAEDKDKEGIQTYIDQQALELKRAQGDTASLTEASDRKPVTDAEIKQGQFAIADAEAALSELDDTASELLSTAVFQNSYTNGATIAFSVLVGVVIIGFFGIAWRHGVGAQLFLGQTGIQFVTLFSLIIAIILFGVLKILEGKELAALLGGLSGYILGRGSLGAQQTGGGITGEPQTGAAGTPKTAGETVVRPQTASDSPTQQTSGTP
jgi:hypothetical protein